MEEIVYCSDCRHSRPSMEHTGLDCRHPDNVFGSQSDISAGFGQMKYTVDYLNRNGGCINFDAITGSIRELQGENKELNLAKDGTFSLMMDYEKAIDERDSLKIELKWYSLLDMEALFEASRKAPQLQAENERLRGAMEMLKIAALDMGDYFHISEEAWEDIWEALNAK